MTRYFKLIICAFCLAMFVTSCAGRKAEAPKDPNDMPVGQIQTVENIAKV